MQGQNCHTSVDNYLKNIFTIYSALFIKAFWLPVVQVWEIYLQEYWREVKRSGHVTIHSSHMKQLLWAGLNGLNIKLIFAHLSCKPFELDVWCSKQSYMIFVFHDSEFKLLFGPINNLAIRVVVMTKTVWCQRLAYFKWN